MVTGISGAEGGRRRAQLADVEQEASSVEIYTSVSILHGMLDFGFMKKSSWEY